MRSTIGIDVAAPPEVVFSLARDVRRWPAMLPHYIRIRVVARSPEHEGGAVVAQFSAIRRLVPLLGLGIPVAWRATVWDEPESRRLRFVHLGGPTAGMDVTWRFEPTAAGCRVEIVHDFAARIPGWARVVDAALVRPIATRTLATFAAIAEAVASGTPTAAPPPHGSQ